MSQISNNFPVRPFVPAVPQRQNEQTLAGIAAALNNAVQLGTNVASAKTNEIVIQKSLAEGEARVQEAETSLKIDDIISKARVTEQERRLIELKIDEITPRLREMTRIERGEIESAARLGVNPTPPISPDNEMAFRVSRGVATGTQMMFLPSNDPMSFPSFFSNNPQFATFGEAIVAYVQSLGENDPLVKIGIVKALTEIHRDLLRKAFDKNQQDRAFQVVSGSETQGRTSLRKFLNQTFNSNFDQNNPGTPPFRTRMDEVANTFVNEQDRILNDISAISEKFNVSGDVLKAGYIANLSEDFQGYVLNNIQPMIERAASSKNVGQIKKFFTRLEADKNILYKLLDRRALRGTGTARSDAKVKIQTLLNGQIDHAINVAFGNLTDTKQVIDLRRAFLDITTDTNLRDQIIKVSRDKYGKVFKETQDSFRNSFNIILNAAKQTGSLVFFNQLNERLNSMKNEETTGIDGKQVKVFTDAEIFEMRQQIDEAEEKQIINDIKGATNKTQLAAGLAAADEKDRQIAEALAAAAKKDSQIAEVLAAADENDNRRLAGARNFLSQATDAANKRGQEIEEKNTFGNAIINRNFENITEDQGDKFFDFAAKSFAATGSAIKVEGINLDGEGAAAATMVDLAADYFAQKGKLPKTAIDILTSDAKLIVTEDNARQIMGRKRKAVAVLSNMFESVGGTADRAALRALFGTSVSTAVTLHNNGVPEKFVFAVLSRNDDSINEIKGAIGNSFDGSPAKTIAGILDDSIDSIFAIEHIHNRDIEIVSELAIGILAQDRRFDEIQQGLPQGDALENVVKNAVNRAANLYVNNIAVPVRGFESIVLMPARLRIGGEFLRNLASIPDSRIIKDQINAFDFGLRFPTPQKIDMDRLQKLSMDGIEYYVVPEIFRLDIPSIFSGRASDRNIILPAGGLQAAALQNVLKDNTFKTSFEMQRAFVNEVKRLEQERAERLTK